MSDTCTTKVLYEDDKRYVVSLTNSSDGTGEYRIKKVTDNLRLKNIKYSLGTMKALMELGSSNIPNNSVTMTYAASGSSGITVADNDNIDFGTGNFTLVWKGSLPDWTPSTANSSFINKYADVGGGNYTGYEFYISSTDNTHLKLWLARADAGVRFTSTAVHGLTDGTAHQIVLVVTRETASVAGSVVFYVDGVQLGSSVAITAAPTVSISNAGALYTSSANSPTTSRCASTMSQMIIYNRALSADEVDSLYKSGVATADQWGSQTNFVINTGFETNTTGWTADGNHSVARITTDHYAGSACAEITATGAGSSSSNRIRRSEATVLTAYKKYRMTYAVKSSGGNTALTVATSAFTLRNVTLDGTWQVFTDEWTVGATGTIAPIMYLGGAGSFLLDEVYIYQTGATLDLEPAGINATDWQDSSTNNLDASYPAAGCTPNLLRPYILSDNGEINVETDMSGKLITDIFLTTIGHASGATYNIILDCEKF